MRTPFVALVLALAMTACRPSESASVSEAGPSVARIAIVDAGSSGTRVHVYEPAATGLVDLTPACTFGPPLAAAGPDAVLGLWDACGVAKLVDEDTPIRIYATGGMRSLGETDPARAAQIHQDLAAALRTLGHVDVESRTIDGVEEARFAWVAANLVRGSFGEEAQDKSVGILELGGSSTQIAFIPDDPATATETLTLDGREHRLFAVSYLHCGSNEARRDLASDSCFFSACESDQECAQSLVDTPAKRGAGDFSACTSAIEAGLASNDAHCSVANQPRPAMAEESFVLIDNFAAVARNLGAVAPGGEVDLQQLWRAASDACTTAWPDLGEPLRTTDVSRRSKSCFDAGLTHTLFELYGLSNSTKLQVLEQTPLWALGAAYLDPRRPLPTL